MCGTREFMAPEMVSDHGYDFSLDWWSFGCVLYELLCQLPPFHGMSERVVTDKILNFEPHFPPNLSNKASSLIS